MTRSIISASQNAGKIKYGKSCRKTLYLEGQKPRGSSKFSHRKRKGKLKSMLLGDILGKACLILGLAIGMIGYDKINASSIT